MSKWTIAKEALEGALAIVNNVPPRNGIKASEFIKISREEKDAASFSLTSDVMAKAVVRTGDLFPWKKNLFLDRRLFSPFVDMGKESRSPLYTFILKSNGSILVKHGGRKAIYEKPSEVTGYENLPNIDDIKTSALDKEWIDLVDAAKQCATDDPVSPQFNCVFLNPTKNGLEIYSGNGRVVFQGKASKTKSLKTPIAFPLLLVEALLLENAQKLLWTRKFAMISFPKGKIWQAVKIAAQKNFPLDDARSMVRAAKKDPVVMILPASTMSRVANRIASYVAALSRESLVLSIVLEKGSRTASIESGSEQSKFHEMVRLSKRATVSTTIEWPLEHVMPILLFCKEDGQMKLHLSTEGRTCLATNTVSLIVARREVVEKKRKKKVKKDGKSS